MAVYTKQGNGNVTDSSSYSNKYRYGLPSIISSNIETRGYVILHTHTHWQGNSSQKIISLLDGSYAASNLKKVDVNKTLSTVHD